jgi:hypothetical protein
MAEVEPRLEVQADEAEARTLHGVDHVPLAVIVHVGAVAAFGWQLGQRFGSRLAAKTTYASVSRWGIDRL